MKLYFISYRYRLSPVGKWAWKNGWAEFTGVPTYAQVVAAEENIQQQIGAYKVIIISMTELSR